MSLLKSEPPGSVKSLEELFAIASVMEQEAADRYFEIAARMRREGNPSVAEVFERLSAEERDHLDSVVGWSQKTQGNNPDPARIRWQLPETLDDEGASTTDPRLMSAYRVLSMAVRNEERAFAFWSYVAAHAEAAEIRHAAETMAREELGHVSILRRERRKAFHAARNQPNGDSDSGWDIATLEKQLAERLAVLAAGAPDSTRTHLEVLIEEARRNAEELERSPIAIGQTSSVRDIPDDPTALAELLTDRYLGAGDVVRDEEALQRVQALAGRAIARLVWLRSDLPELHCG